MSRIAVILLTALVALVPASAQAKTRHRARPKPKVSTTTPVAISLVPGSTMTFDRRDGSAPRVVAVTGTAKSSIKGGYRLGRDNTVTITSGSLSLDPASAAAAGLPPVTLTLNPAMANRVVLGRDGTVTAALGVSFAGTTLIIRPTGHVERGTGLTALTVDSPPQWVTFGPLGAAVSTHLVTKLLIGER